MRGRPNARRVPQAHFIFRHFEIRRAGAFYAPGDPILHPGPLDAGWRIFLPSGRLWGDTVYATAAAARAAITGRSR